METTRTRHLWSPSRHHFDLQICLRATSPHHRTQLLTTSFSLSWLRNLTVASLMQLVLLAMAVKGHTHDAGASQMPFDVHSSRFGTFDFDELEEVVYDIPVIATQPLTVAEVEGRGDLVESNHIILVSKHGQRYNCALPEIPPILRETQMSSTSGLDAATLPNISTLLEPMRKEACVRKTEGWWTYEYCHGLYIKQYHLEAGKAIGKSVWLGFFEKETNWDQTQVDKVKMLLDSMKNNVMDGVPVAYHAADYVNGTLCDITGKQRMTGVKIYCGVGPDTIVEVRERETCNYTLSIQTSRICSHPMFATEAGTKESHPITCSPVLSKAAYEEYLQQEELLKREKLKESLQEKGSASEDKPEEEVAEEKEAKTAKELKEAVFKSLGKLMELSSALFDPNIIDYNDFQLDLEITKEEADTEVRKKEARDGDTGTGTSATGADGSPGGHRDSRTNGGHGDDTNYDTMTTSATEDGSIDEQPGSHSDSRTVDSVSTKDGDTSATTADGSSTANIDSTTNDKPSSDDFSHVHSNTDAADSTTTTPTGNDGTASVDDNEELELILNKIFSSINKDMESELEHRPAGNVKDPIAPPNEAHKRASSNDQSGTVEAIDHSAGHQSDNTNGRTEHHDSQQNHKDADLKTKLEEAALRIKAKRLDSSEHETGRRAHSRSGMDESREQGLTTDEGDFPANQDFNDVESTNWDEDDKVFQEVSEDLELRLQETLDKAGIDAEAKIQLKVVKVPDSMDAGEYADELAKELGELQDSELENRDDLEEEDLTPPVPSYLMNEEERKEERLRAFQQVTSDIADTLSQWINSMEGEGPSAEERKKQQSLESSYDQVWGDRHRKQSKKPTNPG